MRKLPERISVRALVFLLAATVTVGGAVGGTLAWLADTTEVDTVVFADSDIRITLIDEALTEDESEETVDVPVSDGEELTDEEAVPADTVSMIPGFVIEKAPVVTVLGGSEACYLFIKVEKNFEEIEVFDEEDYHIGTYTFDDYVAFSVKQAGMPGNPEGWYPLENSDGEALEGVYYRIVDPSDEDQSWAVLGGGFVEAPDGTEFPWEEGQMLIRPDVTAEMLDALRDSGQYPELSFTAYAIQFFITNDQPFMPMEAWEAVSGS